MCGIAGCVNLSGGRASPSMVRSMIDVLSHRGPDGEGIYSGENVCLGHKRLSIIDVAGSRQPLSNEDETIWVTFNGEIYNYQVLRQKLAARGHVFKTSGDTEALVHLYEEHGERMVEYVQGMFAFAIWDGRQEALFLARDRMGIKPLYYSLKAKGFYFASEVKALLQIPGIDATVNQNVLPQYLTYRSVGAPQTLFAAISKLPPGHAIIVNSSGCKVRRYWDIPLVKKAEKARQGKSLDRIEAETEEKLTASVQRRLVSDVPVGAFLSGGIDSSLIVALMSRLTHVPVKTYSVGFENFVSSEIPYARIVSRQYETDHHELILKEAVFAEHLRHLTWMRDAPLSEPADVPLYLLAKMARRDVKVLLSGEGSDEIFAGYPKYAYDRFAALFKWVPGSCLRSVYKRLPGRFRKVETALRSFEQLRREDRWAQWFSPLTDAQKQALLQTELRWKNPAADYAGRAEGYEALDAMLYTDCKLWLPENLLDRGDRMTMAASVEGRVPFLDHELVEYVFSLPAAYKVRRMTRKWLIKRIAEKYLPRGIIYRKKVGFAVPLDRWFRGQLRELCYDSICNNHSLPEAIFSKSYLRQLLDEHCAMRKNNFLAIWTLLGLALWWDVFVHEKKGRKAS